MAMDESIIQDFLKERAAEVQHASKVIAKTIIDEKNKTGTLVTLRKFVGRIFCFLSGNTGEVLFLRQPSNAAD